MTAVIKPPPLRPAVAGGFSIDDLGLRFSLDGHDGAGGQRSSPLDSKLAASTNPNE